MVSRSQRAIRRDKWVSDLGVATQNHNFTEAHLIPDDDGDADGDDAADDGNDDDDNKTHNLSQTHIGQHKLEKIKAKHFGIGCFWSCLK